MQRDTIVTFLKNNCTTIVFEKVNGEQRTMDCTLIASFLPTNAKTELNEEKLPDKDVVSVWDLEKNSWRSFKLSKLISFQSTNDKYNVIVPATHQYLE